jgi:hypothetical protein
MEKKLYQSNKLGRSLVTLFVVFGVLNSVFLLNTIDVNYHIGLLVLMTVLTILVGFLTAVKVATYSIGFSILSIVLGFIQVYRYFTRIELENEHIIPYFLALSALFAFVGGIQSYILSTKRKKYVEQVGIKEVK